MLRGMPTDRGAWSRLAQYVVDRRSARGWTQADVAERGGLSKDRIQEIEKGEITSYRAMTIGALERGLEWEAGSVREVLTGGEPVPIERHLPPTDPDPAPDAEPPVELPVGANVDPAILLEAVGLAPDEARRVTDFIRGIKAGRQ